MTKQVPIPIPIIPSCHTRHCSLLSLVAAIYLLNMYGAPTLYDFSEQDSRPTNFGYKITYGGQYKAGAQSTLSRRREASSNR
jgi:hypothetical protein